MARWSAAQHRPGVPGQPGPVTCHPGISEPCLWLERYIYINKGCTAKPRLSPTSDKGWAIAGSLSLLDVESMIRDTGLVRSIGPLEALRLETRCVAPGSETSRSTRICALVQPYRRDSSGWKGKSNIQARSSQKEKGLKGTLWKNGSEMD